MRTSCITVLLTYRIAFTVHVRQNLHPSWWFSQTKNLSTSCTIRETWLTTTSTCWTTAGLWRHARVPEVDILPPNHPRSISPRMADPCLLTTFSNSGGTDFSSSAAHTAARICRTRFSSSCKETGREFWSSLIRSITGIFWARTETHWCWELVSVTARVRSLHGSSCTAGDSECRLLTWTWNLTTKPWPRHTFSVSPSTRSWQRSESVISTSWSLTWKDPNFRFSRPSTWQDSVSTCLASSTNNIWASWSNWIVRSTEPWLQKSRCSGPRLYSRYCPGYGIHANVIRTFANECRVNT